MSVTTNCVLRINLENYGIATRGKTIDIRTKRLCKVILYNLAVLANKSGFVSPSKAVFSLRNCRIFAEIVTRLAAASSQLYGLA